jgi:membrane-associated phospholipid phosphatase
VAARTDVRGRSSALAQEDVSLDREQHKLFWALFFVLIGSLLAPSLSHAQDPDRFLKWSYQDGSTLLQDIGPQMPLFAAGGAAVLATGSQIDAPLLSGVQAQSAGGMEDFLSVANEFGSTKMVPVTAGIFAASLMTNDARFQDAAFTSMQSLAYSTAAVFALKYAVGRLRPEEKAGASSFDLFSSNTSFPSGHTATAFAVVTPWVMYYPSPITYGLFALSAGTAVARIAKDRHWPTDVLTGAAIGYFTARYLSNRHQNAASGPDGPRVEFTPTLAPDAVGLNLRVNLN